MITIAKRAIKDHWSDWTEELQKAPDFDVVAYQERLDEIAGTSRGKSILKLEWGGNATLTKYTNWDMAGNPTAATIVPRFAIPRRHQLLDYLMYIPVRRWIITERSEYEQHRPGDDSDNQFTDENGITCTIADKPTEFYTPYIYIGDHTKCPPDCCSNKLCLGDYKHPGRAELDFVLEVTYKLKKEFYCDPYSPLNEAQLAKINKEYNVKQEKRREADLELLDDESRDWWSAHSHRITDEDLSQTKFIYKDGKPI